MIDCCCIVLVTFGVLDLKHVNRLFLPSEVILDQALICHMLIESKDKVILISCLFCATRDHEIVGGVMHGSLIFL